MRRATPDDHDHVVALPDLGGATRRLLAKDLAGEVPRHAVVAVDDGEVVGFAMETRQPDEVHLLDIVVRPDHRRHGIGRRLVTALAALGAADGATAMTLEARVSNPGGPPMYRHLGFTDSGVRPGYYQDGEDAFVMWHHDLGVLARAADADDLSALGVASVVAPRPTGPVRVPDLDELETERDTTTGRVG
nr:GNAT family N-acetyltransferase [Salsipaludibacter albus]